MIEGAIRRQAAYILADPWANSFRETFAPAEQLSKFERHIGRGGCAHHACEVRPRLALQRCQRLAPVV